MKKLFLTVFFSLIPIFSYGWNAVGHMVVANIAYQHLEPTVRNKVDGMIKDLNKEYPDIKTFWQAAPWPDQLRGQKIETFTHWHYIDFPFSEDGTPLKNIIDTDNVIWAIKLMEPILRNTKANPYERARFLVFLMHITGDIHQPLHTTARISADHPDGDQGGNLYLIQYPNGLQSMNLHKFWDGGAGLLKVDPTESVIRSLANTFSQAYPESYFGTKATDLNPEHWGNEGFELASTFVYSTPEHQPPSHAYVTTAQQLTEQQITLAGYRLAHLLNLWIK